MFEHCYTTFKHDWKHNFFITKIKTSSRVSFFHIIVIITTTSISICNGKYYTLVPVNVQNILFVLADIKMDRRKYALSSNHRWSFYGLFPRVPWPTSELLGRHDPARVLSGRDPYAASQNVHPASHHLLTHRW